jgi:arsenate reductase (thioredoxin)
MSVGLPVRVLILCTHNSARSQMAEGLLRALGGARVDVASAGSRPGRVHPLAVLVLAKRGIDISGQRSKHLDEFLGEEFDCVITVCDAAGEACPLFPGAPERIHWSLPDPSAVDGSEAERLAAFERVADDLEARLRTFVDLTGTERRVR